MGCRAVVAVIRHLRRERDVAEERAEMFEALAYQLAEDLRALEAQLHRMRRQED